MRPQHLHRRARALLSVLVIAVAAAASVAASAAPASAAERPTPAEAAATGPAEAFRAIQEAIDRVRGRSAMGAAQEPATDPGATVAAPPRTESAAPASTERVRVEATAGCREAGDSNDVPRVVADIFLCRLTEAGVSDAEARRIAVEAVVVSHCESRWDPDVVVFDGRYRDHPHPYTGNRYSAAGVFQFIRATAEKWIDGGYAQVSDPRRNIDAAARLFIHNRARGLGGWGDWACAAVNDGFKVGSVLPGWPGGPAELPAWAQEYVP